MFWVRKWGCVLKNRGFPEKNYILKEFERESVPNMHIDLFSHNFFIHADE